ncbi:MAG: NAD(P)-dependent alcohol dehydrogenase [Colwellia sp.]|nr:NAD(P)-dependent alcohol dehydrogenase [Colwellia sp.]
MKAVVYNQYGLSDVLTLKEVNQPVPKVNQVLIKVHAVSINDWDWGLLRGKPFVNRIMAGILKPSKDKILGSDIAGTIVAIGKSVSLYKLGDVVFGDLSAVGFSGFAEYVCVPCQVLTLKPEGMSFEQAAAIPQAAVLALQAVQDKRPQKTALKVLINGAGGGSGSFAIQIAKSFGDEVTAVDCKSKFELMKNLGADHVIDYQTEDFTQNGKTYDLIIDMMGYHSIFDYTRSLTKNGRFVMVGGCSSLIFQTLFIGSLLSLFGTKKLAILPHEPNKNMADLLALFKSKQMKISIDKCFALTELQQAMKYFGERKSKGKVIITIE